MLFLPISENCLTNIKGCTEKWKHLDGLQCAVAETLSETLEVSANIDRLGYHTQCYRKFTDEQR